MITFRQMWNKLMRGPEYRSVLAAQQLKRLVPFQIRALRKSRGWSQEELAERSGVTQGVISRAEDPDNGNLTFNTIINIARGLDVAFVGKFVTFSAFNDFFVGLSEGSAGDVPPFEDENMRIDELLAEREALVRTKESGAIEQLRDTLERIGSEMKHFYARRVKVRHELRSAAIVRKMIAHD